MFRLLVTGCVLIALLHGLLPVPAASAQTTTADATAAAARSLGSKLTPQQKAWLEAGPEQRRILAEKLGEDGARNFARSKGWQTLFDGHGRGIPQGVDQIYKDADGFVRAVEAKGGTSPLGKGYGHPQGTAEHAVEAAKRALKSPHPSAAERKGAQEILEAAAQKRLRVDVIRTKHVFGEPTAAVLEQTSETTDDAARLARQALKELPTKLTKMGRAAEVGAETTGKPTYSKVSGLADDATRTGTRALDSVNDAARAGARALDSTDEAVRATAGVAKGGSKTAAAVRGVTKAAPVIGVLLDGGLRAKEAYDVEQAYSEGQISEQARETAHVKNAAGMAGGWGGAAVGAKAGGVTGGAAGSCVAPGPGTVIGGGIGMVSGGIAGYFAGEAAAEKAAEWTMSKIHEGGTTVRETCSGAQQKVRECWENLW